MQHQSEQYVCSRNTIGSVMRRSASPAPFPEAYFFYTAFCLSCACYSCILKQHSKGFGDFPTIKLKSLSWLVFSSTIPFSRHFPFSQFSIGCIYQHGVAINMYLLMYLLVHYYFKEAHADSASWRQHALLCAMAMFTYS